MLYTAFDLQQPRQIQAIHSCKIAIFHLIIYTSMCWKRHTFKLLLFLESVSILELLGFKYCKWIIYICTVYNFQVHEMDYQ